MKVGYFFCKVRTKCSNFAKKIIGVEMGRDHLVKVLSEITQRKIYETFKENFCFLTKIFPLQSSQDEFDL